MSTSQHQCSGATISGPSTQCSTHRRSGDNNPLWKLNACVLRSYEGFHINGLWMVTLLGNLFLLGDVCLACGFTVVQRSEDPQLDTYYGPLPRMIDSIDTNPAAQLDPPRPELLNPCVPCHDTAYCCGACCCNCSGWFQTPYCYGCSQASVAISVCSYQI